MISVELGNGTTAHVHRWTNRHERHPRIRGQILRAEQGDDFLLLFRGQRDAPPKQEDLFLIGQKARPAYHGGNVSRLRYTPRAIAEDRGLFEALARAFVDSPMHRGPPTLDSIMRRFDSGAPPVRFWLSQLLAYALQYQNLRPSVLRWRDYLFVMSGTTDERVALRYAVRQLPSLAYVLEYAPPVVGRWFIRVAAVIQEFDALQLGHIYPDRDSEVFVNYAMFPHYILGYSILHRVAGERCTYETAYVPNPWYADQGATLDDPPELSREQQDAIRETQQELAWVLRDEDGWTDLLYPDGLEEISRPGEDTGMA